MLRGSALHAQRVPTSLLSCACLALACAPLLIVCFAATNCSLRSPHSVDSTPISGAGFPIGFQFLARDPVPRQGFSDFCTEAHFSARFRSHSRGDAQVADSDARAQVRSSRSRSRNQDSHSSADVILFIYLIINNK